VWISVSIWSVKESGNLSPFGFPDQHGRYAVPGVAQYLTGRNRLGQVSAPFALHDEYDFHRRLFYFTNSIRILTHHRRSKRHQPLFVPEKLGEWRPIFHRFIALFRFVVKSRLQFPAKSSTSALSDSTQSPEFM